MLRFRSVVSRIVALHVLAIVVTSICMPLALYLMLDHAAQELHHRALRERAAEILRYLDRGPDGAPRLSLPACAAEILILSGSPSRRISADHPCYFRSLKTSSIATFSSTISSPSSSPELVGSPRPSCCSCWSSTS